MVKSSNLQQKFLTVIYLLKASCGGMHLGMLKTKNCFEHLEIQENLLPPVHLSNAIKLITKKQDGD